jgi:hypothetical protein
MAKHLYRAIYSLGTNNPNICNRSKFTPVQVPTRPRRPLSLSSLLYFLSRTSFLPYIFSFFFLTHKLHLLSSLLSTSLRRGRRWRHSGPLPAGEGARGSASGTRRGEHGRPGWPAQRRGRAVRRCWRCGWRAGVATGRGPTSHCGCDILGAGGMRREKQEAAGAAGSLGGRPQVRRSKPSSSVAGRWGSTGTGWS